MLQRLSIQNYAIITSIDIDFTGGLTIITGETGAGKSILIGALSLILGQRSEASVLMDKTKKCMIEGAFKTAQPIIKKFLQDNDLEISEEIIVRREIASTGKSRAFINDSLVTLSQLREFASLLVDLHQQFDSIELGKNDFQLQVIDALAGNTNELQQYTALYTTWLRGQKELEGWKEQRLASNKEMDYHTFLFSELEDAAFKINELEDIESELKIMNNAESIKSVFTKVYYSLQDNENPITQQVKVLSNYLQSISHSHTDVEALVTRLHSAQIELQDIADEVDRLNSNIKFNTEKIELMNERLSLGYKLLKKHDVRTTSQLFEIKDALAGKLKGINDLAALILAKEKEVAEINAKAVKLASTISGKRKKHSKPFEDKVNEMLVKVGMPNAKIKVSILPAGALNVSGGDLLDFLFDANKSNRFEPVSKVASGGELSRLMLIIKSLVAKYLQLPTLLFDEIDSGISGEAARQVGIVMKDLSLQHQVISITHQPQIAAKATTHYFVYKELIGGKMITSIKLLTREDRVTAIATMLSGESPTAAAFTNAREMIENL